jgi:hypothetical protein
MCVYVSQVEQVAIDSPATGTYTVSVTAKVLTESSSQAVSLVITSGGSVGSKTTSTVSSSFPSNELGCSSGQQMVTINLMDRGGDGWDSGNKYEIREGSSTGTLVQSGTMDGTVGADSYLSEVVCLNEGLIYDVRLIRDGSQSKDMTMDIPQCNVHLSRLSDWATLDLSVAGTCNPCTTDFSLGILLIGPQDPIPYGWKDPSSYILENNMNETVGVGTLATGVMSRHSYCLAAGTYYLEFDDVPSSDDFYDVPGSSQGVDQYRIALANCGGNSKNNDDTIDDKLFPVPRIRPGEAFTITIQGSSSCSYDISSDRNSDDDDGAGFTSQPVTSFILLMGLIIAGFLIL